MGNHACDDCGKFVGHCICPQVAETSVDPLRAIDHAMLAHAFNCMNNKLRVSAAKGKTGWDDAKDCPAPYLRFLLREAVKKGDAVDVMNFAAMLEYRSEPTHVEGEKLEPVNPWHGAVMDACAVAHLIGHADNPRQTINDLINWHVQVALDPAVSEQARELIRRGEAEASEKIKYCMLDGVYGTRDDATSTKNSAKVIRSWEFISEDARSRRNNRYAVPGGWLVVLNETIRYIPDPDHSWE